MSGVKPPETVSTQTPEKIVNKPTARKYEKKSLSDEVLLLEEQLFKDAMEHCRNLKEISKELGISEPTAWRKMKKHGLSFWSWIEIFLLMQNTRPSDQKSVECLVP